MNLCSHLVNIKLGSDVDQQGVVQNPVMQLRTQDKVVFFVTYQVKDAKYSCDTNIVELHAKNMASGQSEVDSTEHQKRKKRVGMSQQTATREEVGA